MIILKVSFTSKENLCYKKIKSFTKLKKMETLEIIKNLTESLSVDTTKYYAGNKSAGTRARKTAQELKAKLQDLRKEILEFKKD